MKKAFLDQREGKPLAKALPTYLIEKHATSGTIRVSFFTAYGKNYSIELQNSLY
jgi:hypothetical protein